MPTYAFEDPTGTYQLDSENELTNDQVIEAFRKAGIGGQAQEKPEPEGVVGSFLRPLATELFPSVGTAVGGSLGALGGGALGLPTGPGAIAAGVAGDIAGGIAGGTAARKIQNAILGEDRLREMAAQQAANEEAHPFAAKMGGFLGTLPAFIGGKVPKFGGAKGEELAKATAELAAKRAAMTPAQRYASTATEHALDNAVGGARLGGSASVQQLSEGAPGTENMTNGEKAEFIANNMAQNAISLGVTGLIPGSQSFLKMVGIKAPSDAAAMAVANSIYDTAVHGKPFDPTHIIKETGAEAPAFMVMNALSHGAGMALNASKNLKPLRTEDIGIGETANSEAVERLANSPEIRAAASAAEAADAAQEHSPQTADLVRQMAAQTAKSAAERFDMEGRLRQAQREGSAEDVTASQQQAQREAAEARDAEERRAAYEQMRQESPQTQPEPIEPTENATQQRKIPEVIREEPQDGIESREAESPSPGDQLLIPEEGGAVQEGQEVAPTITPEDQAFERQRTNEMLANAAAVNRGEAPVNEGVRKAIPGPEKQLTNSGKEVDPSLTNSIGKIVALNAGPNGLKLEPEYAYRTVSEKEIEHLADEGLHLTNPELAGQKKKSRGQTTQKMWSEANELMPNAGYRPGDIILRALKSKIPKEKGKATRADDIEVLTYNKNTGKWESRTPREFADARKLNSQFSDILRERNNELPEQARKLWTDSVYAAAQRYADTGDMRKLDGLTPIQKKRIVQSHQELNPNVLKAQVEADRRAEAQLAKSEKKDAEWYSRNTHKKETENFRHTDDGEVSTTVSKDPPQGDHVSPEEVKKQIAEFKKALPKMPDVRIVTRDELRNSPRFKILRDHLEWQGSNIDDIGAFVIEPQKYVFIAPENIRNAKLSREALIHEIVSHVGLESIATPKELAEMVDIIERIAPEVKKEVEELFAPKEGTLQDTPERRALYTIELLAKFAERYRSADPANLKAGWAKAWDELKRIIHAIVKRLGGDVNAFDDLTLHRMFTRSLEALRDGTIPMGRDVNTVRTGAATSPSLFGGSAEDKLREAGAIARQQRESAAEPKERKPVDLYSAYNEAMVGKTSNGASLRDVYEAAKKTNPELTPEEFKKEIQEADNQGHAYLQVFDSPEALAEAGDFTVRNASGIPSTKVVMIRPREAEVLTSVQKGSEEDKIREASKPPAEPEPLLTPDQQRLVSPHFPGTEAASKAAQEGAEMESSQGRLRHVNEENNLYIPKEQLSSWNEASKLLSGYKDLRTALNDLRDNKMGVPESSDLWVSMATQIAQHFGKEVTKATKDGDPALIAAMTDAHNEALGIIRRQGTELGRGMSMRRFAHEKLLPDMLAFDTREYLLEKANKALDRELPKDTGDKVSEKADEVAEKTTENLSSELDREMKPEEPVESDGNAEAKAEFEKMVESLRVEANAEIRLANERALKAWELANAREAKRKARQADLADADRQIEEAFQRIRQRSGQTNMALFAIDPGNLADYAKIVSQYIRKGILNVGELTDIIRDKFPSDAVPYADKIISEAIGIHNERMASEGSTVPSEARKAEPKAKKESTSTKDLNNRTVRDLMREQAEAGVKSYEDAIAKVTERLAKDHPEITEDRVRDLFLNTERKQRQKTEGQKKIEQWRREGKKPEEVEKEASEELNKAQKTTEKILGEIAETHADPMGWKKKGLPDPVREIYKQHLAEPMEREEFVRRLEEVGEKPEDGVDPKRANQLFDLAKLEIDALDKIRLAKEMLAAQERKESFLSHDSPRLVKLLNDLRKKIAPGMKWRDIMTALPQETAKFQDELFSRIRKHEALQKLTPTEAAKLTLEMSAAWQKERFKLFKDEMKKAGVFGPEVTPDKQEKIEKSLPRILQWMNLGLFNNQKFREAIAPEFGLRTMSDAEARQVSKLTQEAYDLPEGVRRNEKLQELMTKLQDITGLKKWELLENYWVSSVLSGTRTIFDTFLATANGFTYAARAAAILAAKGQPGNGVKAITEFARGLREGAYESLPLLMKGDRSLLENFPHDVTKAMEGEHGHRAIPTGEYLWKKGFWQKFPASVMIATSRAMTAADHINSTATREGMRVLARALHPEFDGKVTFTKEERAKARQEAINEMFDGREPKTIKEKAQATARTREILDKTIPEDVAKDAIDMGRMAAYTNDPTGVYGAVYGSIRRMFGHLEGEARKVAEDESASKLMRALAAAAAVSTRSALGVRFARFGLNFASNASSLLPGTYFLKTPLYGRELSRSRQSMILANNMVGLALGLGIYNILADQDNKKEPDFGMDGDWKNLTYAQRQQLMTAGRKPTSFFWKDKNGQVKTISYRQWEIGSLLTALGQMFDKKRYSPDTWNQEGMANHLLGMMMSGLFSVSNQSSLSTLTELLGASSMSKDPGADLGTKLNNLAASYVGGYLPNALKDLDAWTDDKTYPAKAFWEKWVRTVPVLRRDTNGGRPMLNQLGDPVELDRSPWSRAYQTGERNSPAYGIMADLMTRNIWLPTPSTQRKVWDSDGNKVAISKLGQEYEYAYQKAVGQKYKRYLLDNGKSFENMEPEEVKKQLDRDASHIREEAALEIQDMIAKK